MIAAVALVGAVGRAVGGLLNIAIHRVPRRASHGSPGPRCLGCGAALMPHARVPIASWFLLRGCCRGCGEPIPAHYALVELLTAAVFAAVALVRGVDAGLVVELPFAAMLIAVAEIDLRHRIVPNRIVGPAAVYAVAASALVRPSELPELLFAGGAVFLALLVAALANPAGMGMGDVKLGGVMGLFLGTSVAPALLVGFLAGAVVALALLARRGIRARKRTIPFAPFLAIGGVVGLLAGPELVDLYLAQFA